MEEKTYVMIFQWFIDIKSLKIIILALLLFNSLSKNLNFTPEIAHTHVHNRVNFKNF